jgi:hypothetical protein
MRRSFCRFGVPVVSDALRGHDPTILGFAGRVWCNFTTRLVATCRSPSAPRVPLKAEGDAMEIRKRLARAEAQRPVEPRTFRSEPAARRRRTRLKPPLY